MAKKKSPKKVYTPGKERLSIVTIKGSLAYRDWLSDASETTRIAQTVIVRDALAAWAKANGIPKPPEV